MEPIDGIGGFGEDFPFFWIGKRWASWEA